MNDQDINNHNDELLKIMEELPSLTKESLDKLKNDEQLMQECRNLQMMAAISRTERENLDIDDLLTKFKQKQKKKNIAIRKYVLYAASLAAITIIAFIWSTNHWQYTEEAKQILVFQADTASMSVTLKTERKNNENSSNSYWNTTTPNTLNYQQTDNLQKIAESQIPETHTLSVPKGKAFKIILSDGSEVDMNADSRLIYPTRFTGNVRSVYLEGEAYFKISKDEKHPFIIQTKDMQTKVLGTEFNISSYTGNATKVTLIKGKVEVAYAMGKNATQIKPGEQASIQEDGNFTIKKVELDPYIYWQEGYFYYDNVSLAEIMTAIGRWYNMTVIFRNADAMSYKMHYVADRNQDINHVIKLLNGMEKGKIYIKDNKIYVE